ncbi:MAG TPA: hypothetical protein DCQ31_04385, partial [Bacteroidales bacterium]|nr:hypothetical protein [Bacteroidales bacterium]
MDQSITNPKPGADYRLLIEIVLNKEQAWAPAGHVIAWEQFEIKNQSVQPLLDINSLPELTTETTGNRIVCKADKFAVGFNTETGNVEFIGNGTEKISLAGPTPSFFRAPTDNDRSGGLSPFASHADDWYKAGLDQMKTVKVKTKVTKLNKSVTAIDVKGKMKGKKAKATYHIRYTVFASGDVQVENDFNIKGAKSLAKVG